MDFNENDYSKPDEGEFSKYGYEYKYGNGGSWSSDARHCRSSDRYNFGDPSDRDDDLGFRVALVPVQ